MDIVVSGGSDPDRPIAAPKNRRSYLSELIALGVLLAAAGTAYTGWTVHQSQQDTRMLNCLYITFDASGSDPSSDYDNLPKAQKELVDRFDCDVPGR